ncbi:hypothetical protein QUB80_12010 [Chlorogloeopsis sp. ULAP01]|nr:hypothetical protein [Chlorogloeopsis sp. ULAP01]MDM9381426.1 hypothetical protein [Chlorogloeopsis sp. ULAP01]
MPGNPFASRYKSAKPQGRAGSPPHWLRKGALAPQRTTSPLAISD